MLNWLVSFDDFLWKYLQQNHLDHCLFFHLSSIHGKVDLSNLFQAFNLKFWHVFKNPTKQLLSYATSKMFWRKGWKYTGYQQESNDVEGGCLSHTHTHTSFSEVGQFTKKKSFWPRSGHSCGPYGAFSQALVNSVPSHIKVYPCRG